MSTPTQIIDVHQKLMVVRLNCSFSFGRVTDKSITNKANNDNNTTALVVRKELLPGDSGKHLKALQTELAKFYTYHIKYTLSSVNDGERLLPVPLYLDYMQEFAAQETNVKEKYKTFKADYQRACVQAQNLLNGAYNALDYPDIAELDRFLRFQVKMLPLPTANTLLATLGTCIQADVDSFLGEAVQVSIDDIGGRIRNVLERMVRQLSDPKKRVHDSLTENLAELVGLIPSLNILEDEKINNTIQEMREKLMHVGPEELRNDMEKRKATHDAAQDILRRML